jgi:hypothetical protein
MRQRSVLIYFNKICTLAGAYAGIIPFVSEIGSIRKINRIGKSSRFLLNAAKLHKHHVFPQAYRYWFKTIGIKNIDDYCVMINQTEHLKGVHGNGINNMLKGGWNDEWELFIQQNPLASPSEVFNFAEGLLKRYGLENLPYIKY